MEFISYPCTRCGKPDNIVESEFKICYDCAGEIRDGFRAYDHLQKGALILEKGRGKWYFNIEENAHDKGTYSLAFTPINYWEVEDCFCEVHHLSEEDQDYLFYIPIEMELCDELNYEFSISPDEARKILVDLGLVELTDLN